METKVVENHVIRGQGVQTNPILKFCFKKIAQRKTYINDFGGKWWCKYIVIMAVCTVRIITVYVGQSQ